MGCLWAESLQLLSNDRIKTANIGADKPGTSVQAGAAAQCVGMNRRQSDVTHAVATLILGTQAEPDRMVRLRPMQPPLAMKTQ